PAPWPGRPSWRPTPPSGTRTAGSPGTTSSKGSTGCPLCCGFSCANARGDTMYTLNAIDAAALAEQIVARLTIGIEASGRHVHLSRHDLEALFGAGYQLNRVKELSQPGQFACAERVTLEGPKGSIPN